MYIIKICLLILFFCNIILESGLKLQSNFDIINIYLSTKICANTHQGVDQVTQSTAKAVELLYASSVIVPWKLETPRHQETQHNAGIARKIISDCLSRLFYYLLSFSTWKLFLFFFTSLAFFFSLQQWFYILGHLFKGKNNKVRTQITNFLFLHFFYVTLI